MLIWDKAFIFLQQYMHCVSVVKSSQGPNHYDDSDCIYCNITDIANLYALCSPSSNDTWQRGLSSWTILSSYVAAALKCWSIHCRFKIKRLFIGFMNTSVQTQFALDFGRLVQCFILLLINPGCVSLASCHWPLNANCMTSSVNTVLIVVAKKNPMIFIIDISFVSSLCVSCLCKAI